VAEIDQDPIKFANDWTDGSGVDVAFEVTGHPSAVRAVTDVVRVWRTVSIVAIHSEPMPVNLYQMFARKLSMHGSRLYAREDWEEAIRLAAAGAVTLGPSSASGSPSRTFGAAWNWPLGGGPVMKIVVELTRESPGRLAQLPRSPTAKRRIPAVGAP